MFAAFKRIIKSGWKNFRRNFGLSIAVIGIMAVTLFILSSLLLFDFLTREIVGVIRDKIDLSIYFNTQVAEADVLKARDMLAQIPDIESVTYVSRDQALQAFKIRHAGNDVVTNALEELGGNPLQASLNIKAKSSESYQSIVAFIQGAPFKDSIAKINFTENKTVIDRLNAILRAVQQAGIVIIILFTGLAVLVSFNSIRLAIYSFREEINVMKLVGAPKWFIRGPFVMMGFAAVLFASLVVMITLWIGILWLSPRLASFIPEINSLEFFKQNIFKMFVFQVVTGFVIMTFSTYLAMRKYLKEA